MTKLLSLLAVVGLLAAPAFAAEEAAKKDAAPAATEAKKDEKKAEEAAPAAGEAKKEEKKDEKKPAAH